MRKIIVLGHKSFIGLHLKYQKIQCRLDSRPASFWFLDEEKPNVLINCLGYTGSPNIDACEKNKKDTIQSNTVVPLMLAEECIKRNIKLIHLSSGCYFTGPSPHIQNEIDTGWTENDWGNPCSFYGRSKYATDLLLSQMPNVAILRIRMPISTTVHPRNLLVKLTSYSKVIEEPNSMTFLGDLSRAVDWIIENDKSGIYNVVSPNPLLNSQLLNEYIKYNPTFSYEKISATQLDNIVAAPRSNCILSVKKITDEGFMFEDTRQCVENYVKSFVENLRKRN